MVSSSHAAMGLGDLSPRIRRSHCLTVTATACEPAPSRTIGSIPSFTARRWETPTQIVLATTVSRGLRSYVSQSRAQRASQPHVERSPVGRERDRGVSAGAVTGDGDFLTDYFFTLPAARAAIAQSTASRREARGIGGGGAKRFMLSDSGAEKDLADIARMSRASQGCASWHPPRMLGSVLS